MRHFNLAMVALGGLALLASLPTAARADFYQATNLVTDNQSITPAQNTDPNLVNPWGIAFSATSPFWVTNQGTQTATLYNAAGVPQALVVGIPPIGTNGPTGEVFNGDTTSFKLSDGTAASFIFNNLDGSISAWHGGLTTAEVEVQPTGGASFTGLALANGFLYAADKSNGKVDVYNGNFQLVSVLTDPLQPAGSTPYNIQSVGGTLYVTFTNGTGGAVDILNPNGTFSHFSSDPSLREPWGLALAPSGFGPFGGDLLIGNKFDGLINAFDPTTGAFLGTLRDANGNPIAYPGLWGLAFRAPGSGFDPNTLYFAAGVGFQGGDIYAHGVFGSISVVPEPPSAILLGLGMIVLCGVCFREARRHQRGSAPGPAGMAIAR